VQTPSRTYCRRNGAPSRKTSELNSDSDWPRAQINSRLDICTRWCCVIIWSRTLLPGLLPLAQLPTSFLPMHKKTISQTLIRARPTSASYRIEGFFIPAYYEYRILNRFCVGSRCTSYVAFLSVAFDVDRIYFSMEYSYSRNRLNLLYLLIDLNLTIYSSSCFKYTIYIQGGPRKVLQIYISETKQFREKCFRQKLYGFKGDIRWCHWFHLG